MSVHKGQKVLDSRDETANAPDTETFSTLTKPTD